MATVTEQLILERVRVIEETLNDIQLALNRLVTKSQLNSLVNIRQSEIDNLLERVASLEAQVAILQDS